jgi:hypothetical protein
MNRKIIKDKINGVKERKESLGRLRKVEDWK